MLLTYLLTHLLTYLRLAEKQHHKILRGDWALWTLVLEVQALHTGLSHEGLMSLSVLYMNHQRCLKQIIRRLAPWLGDYISSFMWTMHHTSSLLQIEPAYSVLLRLNSTFVYIYDRFLSFRAKRRRQFTESPQRCRGNPKRGVHLSQRIGGLVWIVWRT